METVDRLAAAHYKRLTTDGSGHVLSDAILKDLASKALVMKEMSKREQLMKGIRLRGTELRCAFDKLLEENRNRPPVDQWIHHNLRMLPTGVFDHKQVVQYTYDFEAPWRWRKILQDERITLFEEYCRLAHLPYLEIRATLYTPRFIDNGFTIKIVKDGKYQEVTVKLE